MRNEAFRIGPLKSLKSLGSANQPFRRLFCYQGLEAVFVSPDSRVALSRPFLPAPVSRGAFSPRFFPAGPPTPRAGRGGGGADPPSCRLRRRPFGMWA